MSEQRQILSFEQHTWPELAELRRRTDLALVPVGQIVQHGPHLPVGTDVYQAEAVCRRSVRELAGRGIAALLGPTIPFGHSPGQEAFPGFTNLRPETLSSLMVDVCCSLARQGFRKSVLVVFGPNAWASAQYAASHLGRDELAELFVLGGLETARNLAGDLLEGHHPEAGELDVHAGELETSLMLAIAPEHVRMEKAVTSYSRLQAELHRLPTATAPLGQKMMSVNLRDWSRFGAEGVSGAAALATAEKGEILLDRVARAVADHVVEYVLPSRDATENKTKEIKR